MAKMGSALRTSPPPSWAIRFVAMASWSVVMVSSVRSNVIAVTTTALRSTLAATAGHADSSMQATSAATFGATAARTASMWQQASARFAVPPAVSATCLSIAQGAPEYVRAIFLPTQVDRAPRMAFLGCAMAATARARSPFAPRTSRGTSTDATTSRKRAPPTTMSATPWCAMMPPRRTPTSACRTLSSTTRSCPCPMACLVGSRAIQGANAEACAMKESACHHSSSRRCLSAAMVALTSARSATAAPTAQKTLAASARLANSRMGASAPPWSPAAPHRLASSKPLVPLAEKPLESAT
mmetsp:Transcript_38480/g.90479  ORF Transcript_38480/g.90479 Transcript_38480/m.90479 type:complete len:298 (+) Transcript_38480:1190-2083(+)